MYDITNVLEGVGLIEKGLKNMIRLKATHMSRPKEMEESRARLRAEIEIMSKEEHRLDRLIRERQEQLAVLLQDENNKKWRYVTQEDINALPCFEDSTLIAIEAPHGTIVEVPDPNESSEFPQRLSMVLRSSIGPINCYLLSRHEERFGSSQTEGMDLCSKHSCLPMDEIMTVFHSNASKQLASESPNSQESLSGIVKIEPSDLDRESDYWFLSELGVRLAEIWSG
ncbi:Transcription factor E2FB [Dendrobium catenatum]|uniref:Transcription factor E2FB n=1 Tax=Dendrobium catenatum TaxID=906689 RepID=A0A2I0WNF1_9ASPA|nr:Transcription factor E2FB [Dendrobium catenatum]